ncbi:TetR/AcrR family transcriptional regulator [Nocardia sp. CDC160]|uniref:TetR/AcrR family transcriptional regulator n=1 Tax=Nocardia sp. CDC160 TaxID=3112166 RepID=UPI002DB76AC5|nr:helix-turn-helix domain-containing protein [Nocardia sp. CDC160]MEC3917881.1 helix-turn-helix domain-containing protein [Nocardia sp. CDC160]
MSHLGTPDADPGARAVRRRPKNRRTQIAAVSAAEFAALGYHRVSMEDIATRLGITSTALYRHFPSKYALFAGELLRLGEVTVAAVGLPEVAAGWPARRRLGYAIDRIIAQTIANRATVGLARWEHRYLEEPDKRTVDQHFATALTELSALIGAVRPSLSAHQRRILAVGIFSTASSLGDHRITLATKPLSALLNSACWSLIETDLPTPTEPPPGPRAIEIPPTLKHELLLHEAIRLFHEHGYPNVTVEDIAAAANLPSPSAVYRYYRGKADLLTTAFRRTANHMSAVIAPTLAESPTPTAALTKLIDMYVAGAHEDRALIHVYFAEFARLPDSARTPLRLIQRQIVTEWSTLLAAIRPTLTPAESQILIHAALTLPVDYDRALTPTTPFPRQHLTHLMKSLLMIPTHP